MNKMEIRVLKVKNANKVILLCFFILSSFHCFSQNKLSGTYFRNYSINNFYSYYEFKENNVFEYHSGGHLGDSEYGKGHYYVKNDSLILNYDLTELKINDYHKYKQYVNNKDSIKVKIIISDMKGNILPKVPLLIDSTHEDFESDSNGEIEIFLKKEKKKINLHVFSEAFLGYDIPIWKNRNYKIALFLQKEPIVSSTIKDHVEKYKIIKLSKEEIELKIKSDIVILKRRKP